MFEEYEILSLKFAILMHPSMFRVKKIEMLEKIDQLMNGKSYKPGHVLDQYNKFYERIITDCWDVQKAWEKDREEYQEALEAMRTNLANSKR